LFDSESVACAISPSSRSRSEQFTPAHLRPRNDSSLSLARVLGRRLGQVPGVW
jgi:hypothetical protein